MSFQTPITIATVLRRIQIREYVLPAIQREFVWNKDQIARLFDSLLREYPIGSFLFWKVDAENADKFKFYGFIKDYHQTLRAHCPILDVPNDRPVTAIRDGQQRLTSLNVGLRGSHASRQPRKWWNNASAFPEQKLYLNVCCEAPENELGILHDFRFFTVPPVSDPANGVHWFPVHHILDGAFDDHMAVMDYAVDNGFSGDKQAARRLNQLYRVIREKPIINFYEETDQDIDKVLDIFIRVNSGGTVLSYSDLLLSIATAQWSTRDARQEIHDLVDELNSMGQGFGFTKDVVLKAGLVLTEVPDIGFKVTNFNRTNMARLEQNWDDIEKALRVAAAVLADFGFSAATLTAGSVLIPVAYYAYRRKLDDKYLVAGQYDDDRVRLRRWIVRTLLKSGIWGSGLDTLLRDLRKAIADHGADRFPVSEIEPAMAARGKSLNFSPEEVDELVEMPYTDKRVFALLALLYPAVDTHKIFHVDHVFPRALFKRSVLLQAGVASTQLDEWIHLVNNLPNLQLLEGQTNVEKQDTLPLDWICKKYKDATIREHYLMEQDLTGLPASLADFADLYNIRKRRLTERLEREIGVPTMPAITTA